MSTVPIVLSALLLLIPSYIKNWLHENGSFSFKLPSAHDQYFLTQILFGTNKSSLNNKQEGKNHRAIILYVFCRIYLITLLYLYIIYTPENARFTYLLDNKIGKIRICYISIQYILVVLLLHLPFKLLLTCYSTMS